MMKIPEYIRNVAVVGHLHHGKTAFLDMLVSQTHALDWSLAKNERYTDVHDLERSRGMTIKSKPISLIQSDLKGKSHLFNFIDTPGHVNFSDEVSAAVRVADGALLVVDVVEGVMIHTEQIIRHLLLERTPFALVINKVDRLILELRLPPTDAYFKIKHTIEEVNNVISKLGFDLRLSPEKGNVAFASTLMGWSFTLKSFAKLYANRHGDIEIDEFAKRLWGDIYFNPEKRCFARKPVEGSPNRTFIQFILEPLYKLYATVT
jgi:U5 small nuclear ribonucleoprotein component